MHLHEILDKELARFEGKPLRILETGTVRSMVVELGRDGDGWSTIYFAEYCKAHGGELVSIDLRVATADQLLAEKCLRQYVALIEGHSISALTLIKEASHPCFDVVLLDSDNDPQLVIHEFLIAQHLVTPESLFLVDDVCAMPDDDPKARKGETVLPFIKPRTKSFRLHQREGWAGYKTSVLAFDAFPPDLKIYGFGSAPDAEQVISADQKPANE
jgi:predicted O-methyltransferase YrrM